MAHIRMDFTSSQEPVGGADAFICTECGEGFGQYPKLLSHMSLHGPIDPFPFDGSCNGFDAPLEFALHENGTLAMVDRSAVSDLSLFGKPSSTLTWSQAPVSQPLTKLAEKGPIKFQCERCGQAFNSQLSLQQHQRYRTLEQGFKCTLCCKVFCDRQGLREHLQDHAHERFYSCGHCGKRFLKRETLHTHQKERHGSFASKTLSKFEDDQENGIEKSYPCKMCGLRFFWLSDLQSHLIGHSHGKNKSPDTTSVTHRQEEVNIKDHCNSTCRSESSPARPYRCGLCGKRFQQLSDLKEHHLSHQTQEERENAKAAESQPPIRRHSFFGKTRPIGPRRGRPPRGNQSKVFPCKHCHRVFVHSSSLSRHMRYHKGTLHTCVYCGRHFPQRCDVTRHIAMYHRSELTEIKPEPEDDVSLEARDENGSQESSFNSELEQTERGSLGSRYRSLKSVNVDDDEQENHRGENPLSPGSKEKLSAPKPRLTYKCRDCGKVFGLLSVYQRHQRYHRRQPARMLHKCPRCRCRFSQLSALERHQQIHENEASGENGKQGSPSTDASQDRDLEHEDEEDFEDENDGLVADANESAPAEVLYECTECTQTFSCLQTFLQHQSAHGSDNFG